MNVETLPADWHARADADLLTVLVAMRTILERAGRDFYSSELVSRPLLTEPAENGVIFCFATSEAGIYRDPELGEFVYETRRRGPLVETRYYDELLRLVETRRSLRGDPSLN